MEGLENQVLDSGELRLLSRIRYHYQSLSVDHDRLFVNDILLEGLMVIVAQFLLLLLSYFGFSMINDLV